MIAAVNGVCAGGGLHFVADADIVIAASDATFLDPHVSVGQVSAYETIALARKIADGADHAHGADRPARADPGRARVRARHPERGRRPAGASCATQAQALAENDRQTTSPPRLARAPSGRCWEASAKWAYWADVPTQETRSITRTCRRAAHERQEYARSTTSTLNVGAPRPGRVAASTTGPTSSTR